MELAEKFISVIIQSIIFILIFSPKVIIHIVSIALAILLLIMTIFMSMEKSLPFT